MLARLRQDLRTSSGHDARNLALHACPRVLVLGHLRCVCRAVHAGAARARRAGATHRAPRLTSRGRRWTGRDRGQPPAACAQDRHAVHGVRVRPQIIAARCEESGQENKQATADPQANGAGDWPAPPPLSSRPATLAHPRDQLLLGRFRRWGAAARSSVVLAAAERPARGALPHLCTARAPAQAVGQPASQ